MTVKQPLIPFDDQRETLLTEFRWERVRRVMEALDWRWHFKGEEARIPTAAEIRDHVIQDVDRLISRGYFDHGMHSGGFNIWINDDGLISLAFIVTDYRSSPFYERAQID